MFLKIYCITLFATCIIAKNLPRFSDLDEEDQHLLRAAYDTPNYNQDEYQEDEDLPPGKLDLLKDGLWALKAKIKELKAFNKAMVANLLATKLKVKELVLHTMVMKKHHHMDMEKKKPVYNNYQGSSYQQYDQQYAPQYAEHQYHPQQPEPQYAPPYAEPQYAPPYAETQNPPQHVHDPYYGL